MKGVKLFFAVFLISCAVNILASRYYRLLEKERKIFLGLRAIDSVAANEFLNLPSPTERNIFYERYWKTKEEEREEFEKRTDYAFREFGKYAPLDDERISIYVQYGPPTRRYVITPEKKVGIVVKEYVRPAEIWTYKKEGIDFDFVRIGRAYRIVAKSMFGDSVIIPFLKEDTTTIEVADSNSFLNLDFECSYGRFRQKKDLVRLELYSRILVEDTTNCRFLRSIFVYDPSESLIAKKRNIVKPEDGNKTIFYDEVNFWLIPQRYFVVVEYSNLKEKKRGKKEFYVDLLDYKNDEKKISDLLFAYLIDDSFTDEKFDKPTGRVVPMVQPISPEGIPFYFYHEVYNLTTKDGMHLLKTDYEIYNKEKMRKEIVDILSQTKSSEGEIAYVASKYHPMDLPAGDYIVVARSKDLLSGEEFTAVGEFSLKKRR